MSTRIDSAWGREARISVEGPDIGRPVYLVSASVEEPTDLELRISGDADPVTGLQWGSATIAVEMRYGVAGALHRETVMLPFGGAAWVRRCSRIEAVATLTGQGTAGAVIARATVAHARASVGWRVAVPLSVPGPGSASAPRPHGAVRVRASRGSANVSGYQTDDLGVQLAPTMGITPDAAQAVVPSCAAFLYNNFAAGAQPVIVEWECQ